jgi:hypothetical protein
MSPHDRARMFMGELHTCWITLNLRNWKFRQQRRNKKKKATKQSKQKGDQFAAIWTAAGYAIEAVVLMISGAGLSGEFNAREPVVAIFEWFCDCLRDASTEYELILPSRAALQVAQGTVRDADLLPSATLNYKPAVKPSPGCPTLKDDLLRTATAME